MEVSSIHILLDLPQHENPLVSWRMSHEQLSRLPPVRLGLHLHSQLQLPFAQDTVMVKIILRLLINYPGHVLLRLGRIFDEEGTGAMRLARRDREPVRDLGQRALKLSGSLG